MKIAIVGTAYPLRGGIAHFISLLAKHLSKCHTVETITFKRQYPKMFFPGKTQEESGEHEHIPRAPQLIDSINPATWIRVGTQIRKRRPDLLIFKYWMPFFAPCFRWIAKGAKHGTSVKVLFICDNIIPHEQRPGDLLLTRYAFKQADFFIVQSDAVEEDLNKYFPGSKYLKVPHPVYELFGTPFPKIEARRLLNLTDERVMLFFGYVRAYKGLHTLLDAMPIVLRQLKVRLLVVGEFYEDERPYREKIRRLGLDNTVTVVPDYVPSEKVRLYFSAADVAVLPYVSATQSGIVQIAYNFDKPVITTRVGGLPEAVGHGETGFLVPPENPQALADAIVRFYRENRGQHFEERVRTLKQEFGWERLVQAIEELAKGS
ncbi:MAG: glycosyltransferase [Bacteroidota bacterium]